MSKFKYSVGPWNVHEGADAYGPATRETIPFEETRKYAKKLIKASCFYGMLYYQLLPNEIIENMGLF